MKTFKWIYRYSYLGLLLLLSLGFSGYCLYILSDLDIALHSIEYVDMTVNSFPDAMEIYDRNVLYSGLFIKGIIVAGSVAFILILLILFHKFGGRIAARRQEKKRIRQEKKAAAQARLEQWRQEQELAKQAAMEQRTGVNSIPVNTETTVVTEAMPSNDYPQTEVYGDVPTIPPVVPEVFSQPDQPTEMLYPQTEVYGDVPTIPPVVPEVFSQPDQPTEMLYPQTEVYGDVPTIPPVAPEAFGYAPQAQPAEDDLAFCTYCGMRLEPGAVFCPSCGVRLR